MQRNATRAVVSGDERIVDDQRPGFGHVVANIRDREVSRPIQVTGHCDLDYGFVDFRRDAYASRSSRARSGRVRRADGGGRFGRGFWRSLYRRCGGCRHFSSRFGSGSGFRRGYVSRRNVGWWHIRRHYCFRCLHLGGGCDYSRRGYVGWRNISGWHLCGWHGSRRYFCRRNRSWLWRHIRRRWRWDISRWRRWYVRWWWWWHVGGRRVILSRFRCWCIRTCPAQTTSISGDNDANRKDEDDHPCNNGEPLVP